MNAKELLEELKAVQEMVTNLQGAYEVMSALAEARGNEIESLQAQLAESQRRERAARLEVCRRCPDGEIVDGVKHYPCDGCEWRPPEEGEPHETV